MSDPGFLLESDMVRPLLPRLRRLAGWRKEALHVFFEVPALRGVPDLVLARLDEDALTGWSRSAVTDYTQVAVLVALVDRAGEGLTVSTARDLAKHAGLSAGHLGKTVLPRLADRGFIDQIRRGQWQLITPFTSPVTRLVTVELKRRDRVGALHQATLHGQGADRAWVVLDAARLRAEEPHDKPVVQAYAHRGIGLATLSRDFGRVHIVTPPRGGGAATFSGYMRRVARALLAERILGLYATGTNQGPTWPVFGRTLSAGSAEQVSKPFAQVSAAIHVGR